MVLVFTLERKRSGWFLTEKQDRWCRRDIGELEPGVVKYLVDLESTLLIFYQEPFNEVFGLVRDGRLTGKEVSHIQDILL